MKKNLEKFRYTNRRNVATIDGMKYLMRVETPRKIEWWLALPAVGMDDSVCVLVKKTTCKAMADEYEQELLNFYAGRITSNN